MSDTSRKAVIIGAGSAGLCMAVQLKKAGIDDFVILEKGSGIGGTWFWNKYPGAECDVQSHLYSFSFEQKNDWTKPFAGQEEILSYLNHIADKYEIRSHIQHDTEVESLVWRNEDARWTVTTKNGDTIDSHIVVSAIGMFNRFVWPDIPGIEDFQGTYWHSSRWNQDFDLKDKTVGVIGVAASAIQFLPEIAPLARQLYVYQRTANWVVPKENTPYTDEQLNYFRENPIAVKHSREEIYDVWNTLCTFTDKKVLSEIEQTGLERLSAVQDEEVRRKLTPGHPFGCRRPLFSDVYYPIYNRDNVELLTDKVQKITATGIETVEGDESRNCDVIIYSTGFETTTYLNSLEVKGRNGIDLNQAWTDGPQAYLGMTTSGFPNLFMLYGPNTNQGSILFMLERQCEYVSRQVERMRDDNLAWMDIRKDVMDTYNEGIQDQIQNIDVWQAECGHDYYYRRGPSRRFVTNWPGSMDAFTEQTTADEPEVFETGEAE